MNDSEDSSHFKQSLSLFDATMIVAGSMIGSGIFIVTANMGRQLGSPGYILLEWVASAIITLIAALSYGELAGMMPKAGMPRPDAKTAKFIILILALEF